MNVSSIYKYAKISPLKARDVAREIQGLPVSSALDILTFTPKKAAFLMRKTLTSAIANAENNHDLNVDQLVVLEARVGEGPAMRRYKPRARGNAGPIVKRTSHITVVVTDELELPEPKAKAKSGGKKKAAPAKKPAAKKEEQPKAEAAPAAVDADDMTEAEALAARGKVYDAPPEQVDDLSQINGVGPVLVEKLNGFGVYQFAQIAEWTEENVAAFDDLLSFKGRIERDNWIEQAKTLMNG